MSNKLTMHAKVASLSRPDQPGHLDFRPLTEADLPAVSTLHAQVYTREEVGAAADQVRLFWDGAYGKLIPRACLGAWKEEKLVGVIFVLASPPWEETADTPFIAELFVNPHHRRQGVAAALVSAAAEACGDSGHDTLTLELDMGRAAEAVGLYQYLGFETVDD